MKLPNWWTNRLRSDYTTKGLLARLAIDLILSNLGFFLGILVTVSIWIFTWPATSQEFFDRMFFNVWMANVPLLTFLCLFAYPVNGLYRGTRNMSYLGRIIVVSKGVGTAFFLFLLLVISTGIFLPRSTIIAGWFFIFMMMLASRLFWLAFSRQYHLVPLNSYEPRPENIARELELLSLQDGWIPPEGVSTKSAWPYFEDDEVNAATKVLRSGKINQWTGQEVKSFEKEFSAFCGVRHAIALANGSIALDLSLYALDIGSGDEVIVTPRTFVASASCVALRGAKPVFADVHADSQNITAESIVKMITPRTRAIIAVHLSGWPCDMDSILEIAEKFHLKVIEDCAQSHGAIYYSRRPGMQSVFDQGATIERDGVCLYPRLVGSMGDVAAFSFCQDKIMTTGGEGGMFLTNDDEIWKKAWAFKDHGKSFEAVYHQQHPTGFRWLHESVGTNGRLTEMQAAIGRLQLRKLPEWLKRRKRNADILTKAFVNIPGLRVTTPPENIKHAYYKYYVFLKPDMLKAGWSRERIIAAINAEGVPCFTGSCSEIYLEKAFDADGMRPEKRLQVAEELGETAMMFLVHPTLSENDMRDMVKAVEKVMAVAVK